MHDRLDAYNTGRDDGGPDRAPYFFAAAIFLLWFAVYARTTAPTVTFHDSGEFITAAWTLGIPHPPGSPVWCVLAHLFTKIPFGTIAFRVNLFSGFAGAAACALIFLLVHAVMAHKEERSPGTFFGGGVAALVLGQAPAFWEKSVQTEVYTLNAVFIAAILLCFVHWTYSDSESARARRLVYAMAFLCGLGAANYMAVLYYVPVLAIGLVVRRPAVMKDWRLILGSALWGLAGLSAYLYLPIRSAANPPVDFENPETWPSFVHSMKRERWGQFTWSSLTVPFATQYLATIRLADQTTWPALGLAVVGMVWGGARRRLVTWMFIGFFYLYALIMLFMQSTTPTLTDTMVYVREYGMTEFHIPLYFIVALFAGIGAAVLGTRIAEQPAARRHAWTATVVALAAATAFAISARWARCDYSRFRDAETYAQEILDRSPTNALLFLHKDDSFFTVMYMRYCIGERPDIHIVTPSGEFITWTTGLSNATPAEGAALIARRWIEHRPGDLSFMLNQAWPTNADAPVVLDGRYTPALDRLTYPDGLVFLMGEQPPGQAAEQDAFMDEWLARPEFALTDASKENFRENMMQVLWDQGMWHDVRGDFARAERMYDAAIRYAPTPLPTLLAAAASCARHLGHAGRARDLAFQALDIDPTEWRALETLGLFFADQGKFDGTVQCFEQILKFHPDNEEARHNLEQARADLERSRKKE